MSTHRLGPQLNLAPTFDSRLLAYFPPALPFSDYFLRFVAQANLRLRVRHDHLHRTANGVYLETLHPRLL